MKTRILIFLAVSAIITLSFTVVSVRKNNETQASAKDNSSEPIGGLVAEDKL